MLLEARAVRKDFRGVPAVDGIDLRLEPGSITGLTGPNGAGKTTLLRLLCGRLIPDSGEMLLDGRPAGDAALRASAAMAEAGGRGFYARLTAEENLRFFGALDGLSGRETMARAEKALGPMGLTKAELRKRFDLLSTGTAAKISLARAFARRPRLMLLDEPSGGLDLSSSSALAALLKELAAGEGLAAVYACHNPSELARVSGRVLVMKKGRLTAELNRPSEKEIAAACGEAP